MTRTVKKSLSLPEGLLNQLFIKKIRVFRQKKWQLDVYSSCHNLSSGTPNQRKLNMLVIIHDFPLIGHAKNQGGDR